MKYNIRIDYKAGKTKYGHIYNEKRINDDDDMEEIELNHEMDKTNPCVCLNIMMVSGDYCKEEVVTKFIESLLNFELSFKSVFIVIDSKSKNEDAVINDVGMNKFIEQLKEKKIITSDAAIKIDALQYKTKSKEYKELLMKMFNYKSIDDIYVHRTYKNAFAYYYSLYNSPNQYMFHIDLPRPGRMEYVKSDNKDKDNNYILKCVHLLKKCERACFIGLLSGSEGRVKNNVYNDEFSAYFDGKIQISLQCWVCDTQRWRPKDERSRYHWGLYRYQTENAISSSIPARGLTSLALHGCEVNIKKVGYRRV